MKYRKNHPKNCKNCGSLFDWDAIKPVRIVNCNRDGYCNTRCKRMANICGEMSCKLPATDGSFCHHHKFSQAVKQTKKSIKEAEKWCQKNSCSLDDVPFDLSFDYGWPDDSSLCREVKTYGDYIRWQQIIRFQWIKKYYHRDVKIVWMESHLAGVQGNSLTFPDWQSYFAWLCCEHREIRQTLKAPQAAAA